jgi:hypothetical protein
VPAVRRRPRLLGGRRETHWSLILWNPWFIAGGALLLLAAYRFQRT